MKPQIEQKERIGGQRISIENFREAERQDMDLLSRENQTKGYSTQRDRLGQSPIEASTGKAAKSRVAKAQDTYSDLNAKVLKTMLEGYEVMFQEPGNGVSQQFVCDMLEPQLKKYEELLDNNLRDELPSIGGAKSFSAMMEWAKVLQKYSASASNMTESKNKLERLYCTITGLKPRNWYEELISLYRVSTMNLQFMC